MATEIFYTTKDGDMLDAICHKHYGHTQGTVEMVLRNNPGLCEKGPVFDAGIKFCLPAMQTSETPTIETIRLYD